MGSRGLRYRKPTSSWYYSGSYLLMPLLSKKVLHTSTTSTRLCVMWYAAEKTKTSPSPENQARSSPPMPTARRRWGRVDQAGAQWLWRPTASLRVRRPGLTHARGRDTLERGMSRRGKGRSGRDLYPAYAISSLHLRQVANLVQCVLAA